MNINGKCLCGQIQYLFEASPSDLAYCHCSECRRTLGSAFASYARVKPGSFKWSLGEDLISSFESASTVHRCFCSVCGTHLGGIVGEGKELSWIALGSIEGDPGVRPEAHIFVGSKAPWHEITDDLPQFDEWPPESSEFHGRFW